MVESNSELIIISMNISRYPDVGIYKKEATIFEEAVLPDNEDLTTEHLTTEDLTTGYTCVPAGLDPFHQTVQHVECSFEIMVITVTMRHNEHRFGFSVMGGVEEGFPPRIDEVSKGSPANKANLQIADEILEVNGINLESATHADVIEHIHSCIKSKTIVLKVKRKSTKISVPDASHIQEAFFVGVEDEGKQRLEKLSATNNNLRLLDMTKLNSGNATVTHSNKSELVNGYIETNPIYTTRDETVNHNKKKLKPNLDFDNPVFCSDNGNLDDIDSGQGVLEHKIDSIIAAKQLSDSGARTEDIVANGTMEYPSVMPMNTVNGHHNMVNGYIGNESVLKPYSHHNGDGDMFGVPAYNMQSQGVTLPQSYGDYKDANIDLAEIEYTEGHREMAIDVPANFRGSTKEPPRYPPQPAHPAPPRPQASNQGSLDSINNTQVSVDQAPTEAQLDRIRKYQEELRKKKELEEDRAMEQEFLRASLRGSKKLQSLEQKPRAEAPSGFVNTGFVVEDEEEESEDIQGDATLPFRGHKQDKTASELNIISPPDEEKLLTTLNHIESRINSPENKSDITFLTKLFQESKFQAALRVHRKVVEVSSRSPVSTPTCSNALVVTQEVQEGLGQSDNTAVEELFAILQRSEIRGVMLAHDRVAHRDTLPAPSVDEEMLYDRVTQYGQESVKIVRLLKSNDPLGATVRNEGEAVIVGRIVKGGAAEKSGLLHEGDEILEVNGIDMRGKNVNDVCDLLANMTGTLTFLIIPNQETFRAPPRDMLVHIKAHFNYDPEDDLYIPCRELGISFQKGDILHVINQDDSNWLQAYREGEDDQALAGLIPSKSFQEQREAMKQTIAGDKDKKKKGKLFCGKQRNKKKRKKLYNATSNDELEAEEILTYEEVALYYPQPNRKRPIVLIGPPSVGRQELRKRLMESDVDRFAAAVPHTSRPRKDGEDDGKDYYFVQRHVFEADITANKFVEHGEFEKNFYGTSLESIRSVVNEGKICVLNLHPQSLKILKASDLKPYVVFIAPPNLEKLRHNHMNAGEKVHDVDLKAIIEKAREMEENFGHYFEMITVNYDIDKAYDELLAEINRLEVEPQWVPAHWLKT